MTTTTHQDGGCVDRGECDPCARCHRCDAQCECYSPRTPRRHDALLDAFLWDLADLADGVAIDAMATRVAGGRKVRR